MVKLVKNSVKMYPDARAGPAGPSPGQNGEGGFGNLEERISTMIFITRDNGMFFLILFAEH